MNESMKCIRLAATIFSMVSMTSAVKAQVFDSTLAAYSSRFTSERCYLHHDKSAYAPGETIWFKAYLMEGFKVAQDSRSFYVDWVDDKGTVLYHTTAPVLAGGISNGQFDIPGNYNGSFIQVRAYTKWMLNFDTAFLYRKTIRIIQQRSQEGTAAVITPSLQFFPEGGEVIAGLRNRIAFKASDQWGRPVVIQGVIEKNGAAVDSLKVDHNGMGSFYLFPEEGAAYSAKWNDDKKLEHTTQLPSAKQEGITLQVSFLSGKRVLTIERTPGVAGHLQTLRLIGTMQQAPMLQATVNLKDKSSYSIPLPLQTLPSGVLTLTVFDEAWNAVAERVVHVNNADYSLPVEVNMQTVGLSRRAKNEIEVSLPDSVDANLSLSITDGDIESDNSNNIVSQFLLSGELRGSVYKPAYYFQNNSDTLSQQLDLVMLTNGWRRFKWEDVTKGKLPEIKYRRDTSYLTLSGQFIGATPAQIKTGGAMMMLVREKNSVTEPILANIESDGSFRSPRYFFFDSIRVYYQPPKNLSKATARFMTSRIEAFKYGGYQLSAGLPSADAAVNIRYKELARLAIENAEQQKARVLQGVTITSKAKSAMQILDEKYTTGFFSGLGARKQFDLINDTLTTGYLNVFDYLQGKIAGLRIDLNRTDGGVGLNWRGGSPILFLDEYPTGSDAISVIPIEDIAYVKVFSPIFIGSTQGGEYGAISVYTRKGNDRMKRDVPDLPNALAIGYSPIREFSSPDYASEVSDTDEKDLRTTLLWKPQVVMGGGSNKASFVFYNTDVYSKTLRVVVEGTTRDGKLVHLEKVIK